MILKVRENTFTSQDVLKLRVNLMLFNRNKKKLQDGDQVTESDISFNCSCDDDSWTKVTRFLTYSRLKIQRQPLSSS